MRRHARALDRGDRPARGHQDREQGQAEPARAHPVRRVMATQNLSRWFVSTDWLARHLDDSRVVVLDGSWHLAITGRNARREYEAAHIPGAIFFDIDAIADTSNPLPHMLPTAE